MSTFSSTLNSLYGSHISGGRYIKVVVDSQTDLYSEYLDIGIFLHPFNFHKKYLKSTVSLLTLPKSHSLNSDPNFYTFSILISRCAIGGSFRCKARVPVHTSLKIPMIWSSVNLRLPSFSIFSIRSNTEPSVASSISM